MQSRRIQISHTHGDQKAGFTKQLETNHNNTLKRRGNIGKDCSVCVDKVGSEKSKTLYWAATIQNPQTYLWIHKDQSANNKHHFFLIYILTIKSMSCNS